MQQIRIGNTDLPLVEYRQQRVVSFAMIDQAHERPKNAAQRNFNKNRHHLIEGEDYYLIPRSLNSEFRSLGITIPNRGMIVLTETGYLMIVKSFTDDLAWRVQRELVKAYFRPRLPGADGVLLTKDDYIALLEQIVAIRQDVAIMRPLVVDRLTRKPKKRGDPITPDVLATMRAMYLSGSKPGEIAQATGRSPASVSWCVRCVKEELDRQGGAQ
jgi:hypothetical protein